MHQQKNGINELMQTEKKKTGKHIKINQSMILVQNRFLTFSMSFVNIWFKLKFLDSFDFNLDKFIEIFF